MIYRRRFIRINVHHIVTFWTDHSLCRCFCSEPYEPKPVLGAALTAVRGKPTGMDLVRVETRSQVSRADILTFQVHRVPIHTEATRVV